jgi:hypothetical protein
LPSDPFSELDQEIHREWTDLQEVISLPSLPQDPLQWIDKARPIVDGQWRNFLLSPFWLDIYNDHHWDVMVLAGRQVFKSTYCTDMLAWEATRRPGIEVAYITHDQDSLSAFSNQRLRVGTFEENEVLALFPRHGTGNVGEISLKNKSTIYMITDHNGYKHGEGKSLQLCMLDEAQYQDVQYLPKLEQTMMRTHGKMRVLGIGGESGSPYHRMWQRTDQREWQYANPLWREGLQFDSDGLVVGEYLIDLLRGRWVADVPKHAEYHGYHLPQTIFPQIPLTIEDAVTKYKIAAKFSIEAQQKRYPQSIFTTHVMGGFHRAIRRPITREMMLACMEPYSHMTLLDAEQVQQLKVKHGNKITVSMGIDWGSGPSASLTVICIMIYWKESERYQIVHIEPRPQENLMLQAKYAKELFEEYNCDIGIADLGYGVNQVKLIQDGGADAKTGDMFNGLGTERFLGCNSMSAPQKPFQYHDVSTDQHGDTVSRIGIDKTAAIQEYVDMVDRRVPLPEDPHKTVTQLIIPYKNQSDVDFLINDSTALTRKDLAEIEDVEVEKDPRQRPRKEFNHPRDSVMSIIYSYQGARRFDDSKWTWVSA